MRHRVLRTLFVTLVMLAVLAGATQTALIMPSVNAAQTSPHVLNSSSIDTIASGKRITDHRSAGAPSVSELSATQTSLITATAQINPTTTVVPVATTRPTITPVPSSDAARLALAFIAKREGIPVANLAVVNEFPRKAELLGRSFQAVTVGEQREPGRLFEVLVDLQSEQIEDRATIERLENQAARAKYSKLDSALSNRLQKLPDDAKVTVMIWATEQPGRNADMVEQEINATLSAQFPQAREALARSGKPMDVSDPDLADKISAVYNALQDAAVAQRVAPLAQALRATGATITTTQALPAVFATLTKREIQTLVQRNDVSAIALSEAVYVTQLDSAIATNQVSALIARFYNDIDADIEIIGLAILIWTIQMRVDNVGRYY